MSKRISSTTTQAITGLIIIAIGVGALLDSLQVLPFWGWFGTWWPSLLIVAALLVILNDLRSFVWSAALAFVGTVLLLRNFDVVDVNVFSLIWPAIIIAVGVSIMLNRANRTPKNASSQDVDNISAILGGAETRNQSQNYQGGKATAVLGGVTLDLRDAAIKKEATLNVFAFCGGIEIKVPKDWQVKSHVFPILGGVENKASDSQSKKGPVLIITGNVALGGVEVKY